MQLVRYQYHIHAVTFTCTHPHTNIDWTKNLWLASSLGSMVSW